MFHCLLSTVSGEQTQLQAIEGQLLSQGSFFEIEESVFLGRRARVFKNRAPSLVAILKNAQAFSDREYLVFSDGHNERRFTFEEHERWVASTAAVMRDRYGIKKGDRVAILAANCPEWIVSFWAAVSLGAIAVGMNAWWTGDEIDYAVDDSDPTLLIIDRKRFERMGSKTKVAAVVVETDFATTFASQPNATLPEITIDEEDAAIILYTSGTTGRPKGVVHVHGNVTNMIAVSFFHGARLTLLKNPEPQNPPPTATILVTSPLFHVSGLHCAAITAMASGAKTVWTVGRFDPALAMKLIEKERVTGWGYTSTILHRLLNHPDVEACDFSSFQIIGGGGSLIPPSLLERTRELMPQCEDSMGVGYGLTEGTAFSTLNPGNELRDHPASAGRPVPIVDVEIRDDAGGKLGDGDTGTIFVRGALVMKEYWRNEEATEEAIDNERWLNTGDLGAFKDGRLYLASRQRDLILRGGENVYPAEVELCLQEHPDVAEVAVVGVPSEEFGQEVKAVVVPKTDTAPTTDDLGAWVHEKIAYYKAPTAWEFRRQALPRTATGKVLKDVLIDPNQQRFIEE